MCHNLFPSSGWGLRKYILNDLEVSRRKKFQCFRIYFLYQDRACKFATIPDEINKFKILYLEKYIQSALCNIKYRMQNACIKNHD